MLDPITYSEIIAGRIMDKVYEGFSANTAEGKIVPSLAALELLGPRWRWRTQAYGTGPLHDGQLPAVGRPAG